MVFILNEIFSNIFFQIHYTLLWSFLALLTLFKRIALYKWKYLSLKAKIHVDGIFLYCTKVYGLMYRIQKNSMNITCFPPKKIIFNLVRLLHTLRKQLNFKYKMSFFFKINLQEIAGACSTSYCALNEKCIPKPFGEHECVLSGMAFLFFHGLFSCLKWHHFLVIILKHFLLWLSINIYFTYNISNIIPI